MTRLIALGTLSLVVALSLAVVPLVSAQISDSQYTASPSPTVSVSPSVSPGTDGITDDTMNDSTSPGLPDTGAGGDAAMNFSLLLVSGLVMLGGLVLLARRVA